METCFVCSRVCVPCVPVMREPDSQVRNDYGSLAAFCLQGRSTVGKDNGNAAKSQYQAIFETAIDGIIVLDEHGIIQSFNRAAQELFGYEPGEVMGQNVRMLMPDPDRTLHDSYLANYRTTGVPKIIGVGREVIGRGKDGSSIPLDLSIAQWTADGCRYFTGIVRDLTERKRSEEQRRADEARYRAIVDTAVDAIVVIDERGLIQSFNNAAERLFGYSAEEAIGETVNVLMPEHYESEHDWYMQNYKSTGVRKI